MESSPLAPAKVRRSMSWSTVGLTPLPSLVMITGTPFSIDLIRVLMPSWSVAETCSISLLLYNCCSQLSACSCGSMISGQRLERSIMMAVSMAFALWLSPASIHSATIISSPAMLAKSKLVLCLMFKRVRMFFHSDSACDRSAGGSEPQYATNADASNVFPRASSTLWLSSSAAASHCAFSVVRALSTWRARSTFSVAFRMST
mmetsp:Transcript_15725/g.39982  ORF Transcript_15725/g.39982 Transcript_15725/m.39982 type:complete len:203 (-) Transcript_15725:1034-1642(-)